jgi:hypothetical protein
MSEDLEHKITRIEPVYDFDNVAGGYFKLYFGMSNDPFKLSFVPFLDYHIRKNEELFNYLKKTSKDLTVSHAIYDLYDIGFPLDEWVDEYIDMARSSIKADLFNKLITFYNYIKDFNSSGSLDKE